MKLKQVQSLFKKGLNEKDLKEQGLKTIFSE